MVGRSHSFTNLLYHIVFSTKNREPWLDGEVAKKMFAYLGGLIREQGGIALCINGVADHVHLLVKLRQDHPIADVVRHVKARSSFWFHKTLKNCDNFAWQSGYGAFTVSQSQVEVVRNYILNQEAHHRNRSYEDELREFLRKNEMEFSEEQLWD